MNKSLAGENSLSFIEEKDKPQPEQILDFVHNELDLKMRDVFNMSRTNAETSDDPRFDNAYQILGVIGLGEKVKEDIAFQTRSKQSAGGVFLGMWSRLQAGKLGEGEFDNIHIKHFAEEQARKIWHKYVEAVHVKKHGVSTSLGNRGVTEKDLFTDEE